MKRSYKTLLSPLTFFLLPLLSHASDVRVNAAGQLSLVTTDETTDLNPYNLGNPAGLVLLPDQYRLQAEPSWGQTNSPAVNFSSTSFGLSDGNYRGFLAVPGDNWAFQVTGGLTDENPESEPSLVGDEQALVAYRWGLLSVGMDILAQQDGLLAPGPDQEANGSSDFQSTSGVNLNLPLGPGPDPDRIEVGGTFSFFPVEYHQQEVVGPAPPVLDNPVTFNYWEQSTAFTPAFFFEVPNSFQGLLEIQWYHFEEYQSGNGVPFTTPEYLSLEGPEFLCKASYLYHLPLANGGDPNPWTFNHGLLLQYQSEDSISYNPNGTVNQTSNLSSGTIQLGLGLEHPHDCLIGVQADYNANNDPAGTDDLQIGLGGEWWVTPQWALRAGWAYLADHNTFPDFAYGSLSGGASGDLTSQEWRGSLYTLGAGYEAGPLNAEVMGFYEPIQAASNPTLTTEVSYGAELSLAWHWDWDAK